MLTFLGLDAEDQNSDEALLRDDDDGAGAVWTAAWLRESTSWANARMSTGAVPRRGHDS